MPVNEPKKIPTTILTGFLGSGKTTFLNHLIQSKPDTRFAIIENEFGEESIDGDLIVRSSDDIVEMNNGCLCCTLNENLYDLLGELHERRADFDALLIEATGVADPAGLAEPFLIHPAVKKTFELQQVICLVDAEQAEDQLKQTEEARKQIAFSDVLLLNKTDLVSPEYVKELQEKLSGINPTAEVLLKKDQKFPVIKPSSSAHLLKANPKADASHSHSHSHRHNDISTHALTFDTPVELQLLYHLLLAYLTFQAKDTYRVKGILHTTESNQKYLLQSVGKRLGIEPIGEWKTGEERKTKIVFIGKNLQLEALQKLIERSLKAQKIF